jgi:hypothetical protein
MCWKILLSKRGEEHLPKCISIAARLSIDTVENRDRRATDPVERSHFQIIWLLVQGKRVHAVAEMAEEMLKCVLLKALSVLLPWRVVLPFPYSDAHADVHRSSKPVSLPDAVKK